MKKNLCLILFFVLIGSAFAKSDLSFNLGGQIDWAVQYFPQVGFNFGVENYNLFNSNRNPLENSVFSLGFMEAITGIVGQGFWANFLIGFALGAKIKDVVQFRISLCPFIGFDFLGFSCGCSSEIETKFIPVAQCSPLMGFRYQFDFLNEVHTLTGYLGFCINFNNIQKTQTF